ncbi:MAG: right-handed parallel beta-helix repeat-containing protein [Hydrogenophaga sp.]|uniref:right-handed parallel beta-helix repeat-containing protein n=1 Tax=Hydrogenophaga sp. TaxID=1904254 RepID=UPI00257AC8E0|nr:right-handed parallel beta-helix repeat-containing protein [Hydrogenophaga sp.]MBL0944984.1 right-handed parallel beta-helix repeat-containing protein [Hydrogenophaga sp.]
MSIADSSASCAFTVTRPTLALLFTATLAACGGGGGGGGTSPGGSPAPVASTPSPTPPPAPVSGTLCDSASGRVLEVGPGKPYASPNAASRAAVSGDVIRISAGDYRGAAALATWSASNLTICGTGGRARLFADGLNQSGKGIWVVAGTNIAIDNLEFRGATVPDQNGAGIRAEHGGELRIANSGFYDNENGLLAAAGASTITIDRSEFARNGRGDGYTHNLYVNAIDRLTVRSSFFREARVGHNLKSRARETVIEHSYFMDGTAGTASYQADFPNGGRVVMRGNLLQKGPSAQNANLISYGNEGLSNSVRTLELYHNTLVNTRSGGAWLSLPSGVSTVRLTANLLAGTGNQALTTNGFPSGSVLQTANVTGLASNIPGATNLNAPNFWPDAALQAQIGLAGVPDAAYTQDAPQPYTLRNLGAGRVAGAVQSAP